MTASPGTSRTLPSVRVERFFARHLRHLTGRFAGEPFLLDRWEREVVATLFDTRDRRGLRVYREGLVGIARGNGKTPFAYGLALYGLYADGEFGGECFALAPTKPVARIGFDMARQMVLADPYLRAASRVYRDAIEVPETGAVFRVLSSDTKGSHGWNPHFVVVDELHQHRDGEIYYAMRSALHKRSQPLLLSITTAGWDRDSICWELYQRGRAGTDRRFYFRWHQAPDGCELTDTAAWRDANPASWVTIQSLRDQLRAMPEPVFRRLHLNQWTSTAATWIPMSLWDECVGDTDDRIDEHGCTIPVDVPVVVAVDAAPKRDTTAVVVDWRDDDGHHHWRYWIFARSDRAMGYLDYGEVEDLLREIARTWDVRRILFDPFTMMRSMLMLAEEGLPVEEYPQNDARMVPAAQTLYDLVLERRLHHGGQPDLRAQAAGAVARETPRGWRLDKLRSTSHIDALVAGAMAARIAEQDAESGGGMVWALTGTGEDLSVG